LNALNLNLSSGDEGARASGAGTQMVFVSATMPRDMKTILHDFVNFDRELNMVNTANVNKVMMHVPQTFMRLNGVLKVQKLTELVLADVKKNNSVMIFSNTAATATFVHKLLQENGINSELFHSSMDDQSREMAISNFLNGTRKVISCTDMASRGLDTVHVKHVINFDTPKFIADYVHRLGRVGRLGSPVKGAHVTTFVSRAFEVDTVWNIERSVRLSSDLHNLNANITRILAFSYQPRNVDRKNRDVDNRSGK
jgi:superfamily II DNA/RNA helicase